MAGGCSFCKLLGLIVVIYGWYFASIWFKIMYLHAIGDEDSTTVLIASGRAFAWDEDWVVGAAMATILLIILVCFLRIIECVLSATDQVHVKTGDCLLECCCHTFCGSLGYQVSSEQSRKVVKKAKRTQNPNSREAQYKEYQRSMGRKPVLVDNSSDDEDIVVYMTPAAAEERIAVEKVIHQRRENNPLCEEFWT